MPEANRESGRARAAEALIPAGATGPTGATGVGLTGATGPTGPTGAGFTDLTYSHTYMQMGTVAVTSGATNYFPPFSQPVKAGRTVTFLGVRGSVRAGTASVRVYQNSTLVSGLGSAGVVAVSGTRGTALLGSPAAVVNADDFSMDVSAAAGADGLSVTLLFEVI